MTQLPNTACPHKKKLATTIMGSIVFWLAGGAAVGSGHQSGSGATQRPAGAREAVVFLGAVDEREPIEQLARVVESHIGDLRYRVVIHWLDSNEFRRLGALERAVDACRRHRASIAFWSGGKVEAIDRVSIFIAHPDGSQVVERRLERGERPVKFEAVAIIIRSAIEALEAGDPVDLTARASGAGERPTVPAQPPAQQRQTTKRPKRGGPVAKWEKPHHWSFHVAYESRAFSPLQLVTHGLQLGIAASLFSTIHFGLGYGLTLPFEVASAGIEYRVRAHPFTLSIGRLWLKRRFHLTAMVALTVDYLRQETLLVASQAASPKHNEIVSLAVGPSLAGGYAMTRHWWIRVGIGAQMVLQAVDFVAISSAVEELDRVYRFRPFVSAGIVFMY